MRQFIDFNYFKDSYKSPYADKIENNFESHFDYYNQRASQAVYDTINIKFDVFEQLNNQPRIKAVIRQATAMMLEHYYVNGTNLLNAKVVNENGEIKTEIEFIEGFNPSIVPDAVRDVLANEGIFVSISNETAEFEALEVVLDLDVISTSVRTDLINKNQLDINEQLDIEQKAQRLDIDTNTLNIDTKVDTTVYEQGQADQDTAIAQNENTGNVNRELIEELIAGQQAGGTAFLSQQTPFDENDPSVGRATATFTPQNSDAPIKINPSRPNVLNFTQETGYKTIDVYSNGVLVVDFLADIERATTSGIVNLKIELVDIVGNIVVDETVKKFDLSATVEIANQIANLQYEIVNISSTITSRRFLVRYSTTVSGDDIYINGGATTSTALNLTSGTEVPSTTEDVINLSSVIGTTATDAFNTLNAEKVNGIAGVIDFDTNYINTLDSKLYVKNFFNDTLTTTAVDGVGAINELNVLKADTTYVDTQDSALQADIDSLRTLVPLLSAPVDLEVTSSIEVSLTDSIANYSKIVIRTAGNDTGTFNNLYWEAYTELLPNDGSLTNVNNWRLQGENFDGVPYLYTQVSFNNDKLYVLGDNSTIGYIVSIHGIK